MKTVQFSVFTLFFLLTLFLSHTFAQDSPQWHLPEGAIARFGKGVITDIKYSPDGTRLAVGADTGVWIYDALTGEELDLFRIYTSGPLWSIAYSPNGRLLAGGSQRREVPVWDTVSGQRKHYLIGHVREVTSVSFSPDGQTLATGSYDGTVRLWDAVSGNPKTTLTSTTTSTRSEARWIYSVSFSPDGQTLATGSYDGTVRLWDVVSGKETMLTEGWGSLVRSVSFSPDGQTLVSRHSNGTVQLWDVVSGNPKTTLAEHTGYTGHVLSVSFSPDGQTLATGSYDDGTVRLWGAVSGTHKTTLTGYTGHVRSVSFSPDGQTLATGSYDGTVRLWDVVSGTHKTTLTGYRSGAARAAFSPDGQTLAIGRSDGTVRLWDAVSGKPKTTLTGHTDYVWRVSFSPDGQTLAGSGSRDGTVRLWDVDTGTHKTTLTGPSAWIRSVPFSPDGQTLAIGRSDGTVGLWDAVSGKPKITLTALGSVTSVSFSPDGQTLATGSNDGTLQLWDAVSGTHKNTLTGHTNSVTSLSFSPDGQTLVSAGRDGYVRLWDVASDTHKSIGGFLCNRTSSIAFSPDGRTFTIGTDRGWVFLYDVATGERLNDFRGSAGSIQDVVFSSDGRTITSVSEGGTVVLWDVAPFISQQDQPATVTRPRNMVRLIYFLPRDRQPKLDIDTQMDTLIKEVQQSYADDMVRHGFGRKTFTFETDATGKAVVHHLAGQFTADHYEHEAFRKVLGEVDERFDTSRNIYLVVVDSGYLIDGAAGKATLGSEAGGVAIINGIGDLANYVYLASHELRHTFGLAHDFSLDPRGFTPQISKCTAEWLTVHRYFNTGQTAFNEITTIGMLSQRASRVQLQLADADGLHQVQFLIPTTGDDSAQGTQLHSCKLLNGSSSSTFEFVAPEFTETAKTEVTVQVIDVYGNINKQVLPIETDNVVDTTNNVTVSLSPSSVWSPGIGQQLTFSLHIAGGSSVAGYQATVGFDASALRYVDSANGDYLPAGAFFVPPVVTGNSVGLAATSLAGESNGSGTLATLTFEGVAVKASTVTLSEVILSDSESKLSYPDVGNGEVIVPPNVVGDVNGDGVVNIQDLVRVGSSIGQTGQTAADVNGDGVVNIADLVTVANAFGNAAAAPVIGNNDGYSLRVRSDLNSETIQKWLDMAHAADDGSLAFRRGIAILEQFLAVLTPKETALLPNYPNPFNPETWIPYHLAHAADVVLAIYDTKGVVVRQLDLGHQSAGYYTVRSKAAYWDGRTESGESVASGVYFYQLTAGDFSAMRKMIILK